MSEFELIRDGEQAWDVVVVGGGTAGLSGALNLARVRRSVLVIDKGEPRNAPAAGAHGVLGRESISPLELLRLGREEVAWFGRCAAGRARAGRTVGAGRAALRVLPRLGSPGQGHRSARQLSPGTVVPSDVQGRHAVPAHRNGTDRRTVGAAGCSRCRRGRR
ncbi:FAD-dependent oxidoreductase [Streptomyces pinistramenti]|uniref:FAD-dependent oxidoreductase n=1 Tax=Streptomyces pinistramenti TaxID=2884812 RepID=UPI0035566005